MGAPDVPLPRHLLQLLQGGAQGVPRPAERHSAPILSWVIPWASSHWEVPGTPPEEGVQKASSIDTRATSIGSSRCAGAAALLQTPPGWPSSSICKEVPSHPTEKVNFSHLYLGSCSFGHDPNFMAMGEDRNIDRPVNQELRFTSRSTFLRRPTSSPILPT
ncbi:hypothetical protein GOODEAATRI_012312 [Goodea atripinnis]|uniref:Uncharacterized protein n=1 Tax=Goodea atripinnis TaxID=208336 RepID=A0ABV0N3Z3_9TELE